MNNLGKILALDSASLFYHKRAQPPIEFIDLQGNEFISFDGGVSLFPKPQAPSRQNIQQTKLDGSELDEFTILTRPYEETAMVHLWLARETWTKVRLRTLEGVLVSIVCDQQLGAGKKTFAINLDQLRTGSYLCEVQVGNKIMSQGFSIIR